MTTREYKILGAASSELRDINDRVVGKVTVRLFI